MHGKQVYVVTLLSKENVLLKRVHGPSVVPAATLISDDAYRVTQCTVDCEIPSTEPAKRIFDVFRVLCPI